MSGQVKQNISSGKQFIEVILPKISEISPHQDGISSIS